MAVGKKNLPLSRDEQLHRGSEVLQETKGSSLTDSSETTFIQRLRQLATQRYATAAKDIGLGTKVRGVRPAIALAAGVVAWEAIGRLVALPWFPPFSRVVEALVELSANGEIWSNLRVTLRTLALGFLMSVAIGIPLGIMMGRLKRVEQAFGVYVYAGILVPGLAMAPIYFAIFGLADMTRILIVVQFAVFFLIVNTATAVRTVDKSLEEMGEAFGASRYEIMRHIVIPASLVLLLAGVKIAVGRSIKGMISGEMFIAVVGLGGVIQKYGSQFDASKVLAIALITLLLALVLGGGVGFIDRKLTSWSA